MVNKETNIGCFRLYKIVLVINVFSIAFSFFDFIPKEYKFTWLISNIIISTTLVLIAIIVLSIEVIQKRRIEKFSYKREKREAQKVIDSLPFKDKERDVLYAYICCLEKYERYEKEQQLLTKIRTSNCKKKNELILNQEAKLEQLKISLDEVKYEADKDLTDEQRRIFRLFCESFINLCKSDKIWFQTGVRAGNFIEKKEAIFTTGSFDYIKSEFDIPAIHIPNTSVVFYFYPRFIIRSESTTKFKIYPLKDIEILYDSQRFSEQYTEKSPKDAIIVSTNFLYETKDGLPDRRYSYNPLLTTYEYGKLILPFFSSMTFFISNRDFAKDTQEAYVKYISTLPCTKGNEKKSQAEESKLEITPKNEELIDTFDLSRIEHPDPMLKDVINYVILEQIVSISYIQRKFCIGFNRAERITGQLEELGVLCPHTGLGHKVLIGSNGKNKEDNTSREATKKNKSVSKSFMSELDALVGLASVKEEIKTLSNFIKIQQKRKEQGLKSSSVSYHCVFTGNPGTGKTTVARIVAQIYKDLGILSKGHLVETDRAGLVAEYVGQTAVKTNKIIDSALDGVLFIDEAYSLIGTGQDYGKEAIATLLKRMEDDRDRLVVILAGYSKEMQDFLNTNPGLQSRFNRYIEFPDYSAEELLQIFEKNVAKFDYKLEKEVCVEITEYFQNAVENKDTNFGNARFVRNIFEKTLEKQANRLSTDPDLTKEELRTIIIEDLPLDRRI